MKYLIPILSILFLSTCSTIPDVDEKPTNVILILTDDQGFGDVAIHGNDSIDTPNLDKLAAGGIRMDNFYVSPVCAPTRASLLTGRYHYRTGTTWVTRNGEAMRSEEVTVAEVLKANGYATGAFGKWHNGSHFPQNPNGQGFEEFTGFCGGHWNRYIDPELENNGQVFNAEGYITDIFTDSAMTFISQNYQKKPFFAYLPFNTPHTPYIAPANLYQKYKNRGHSDKIASSYGMVESIDQNIGKLLKHLKNLDILENTLVIFITDNGPNYDRYNAGMKGRKGWVNDGGVRVPCFIYHKGQLEAGKIIKQLTAHIDLLPTLSDYLGLERVETLPLDGTSFASLLTNDEETMEPRNFYTFSTSLNKFKGAIRTQEYRLTIIGEDDYQLTQLIADPGEAKELKDSLPELAQQMYNDYLQKYDEVTKNLGSWLPLPVGHHEVPQLSLPAHEGFFTGGISYKASKWGWCNDWFINWESSQDTMYWKLEVANPTRYKVSLQYTCEEANLGSTIVLENGSEQITATLNQAFTPEQIPSYEQVPRIVEAFDQTWGQIELGEIILEKGSQQLSLFASDIPNGQVAELKALILERMD